MGFGIPLEPARSWIQVASGAGSILALVAAGFWFIRTSKAKQRIQFDLDCRIHPLAGNPDRKVAEVQFCFENKGFVEHRIYDLTVSIHALESEEDLAVKPKTGELQFRRRILSKTQIVPPLGKYYFIRPGIRQVVTHIVPVDAHASLIRITAGFYYVERGAYPHTARQVFSTGPVSSESKATAGS